MVAHFERSVESFTHLQMPNLALINSTQTSTKTTGCWMRVGHRTRHMRDKSVDLFLHHIPTEKKKGRYSTPHII